MDTFATVKLNSETILVSENMFIPHRVDVTQKLKSGENMLEIEFDCAMFRARAIKDAHPEHKFVGFNCDMARLAIRKAQYHWYVWLAVLLARAFINVVGTGVGTGALSL